MSFVLIVEDHQAVREALTEVFLGWGYTVIPAVTMDDAMAHIRTGHFELVITDMDLGGSDGLELARMLGNSGSGEKFIVLSGRHDAKEVFGNQLETGNRLRHLRKPFLLSQLQTAVAQLQNDGVSARTD